MLSSTDSIAQLAAALAKAQVELVNPAKTLSAVIDRSARGREAQNYRYAPLSSGLDIARKTLGKHELAVIQTTHIERDTGCVVLTSTLAHSSGEWIASSWPVCRAADMQDPKLMGAALTYARRYSLFALIGLAGEDDLDAPEMERHAQAETGELNGAELATARETINGVLAVEPQFAGRGRTRRRRSDAGVPRRERASIEAALGPASNLSRVRDADELLRWALENLPARNKLSEDERGTLDLAFLAKAEEIGADPELLLAFQLEPASGEAGLHSPAHA